MARQGLKMHGVVIWSQSTPCFRSHLSRHSSFFSFSSICKVSHSVPGSPYAIGGKKMSSACFTLRPCGLSHSSNGSVRGWLIDDVGQPYVFLRQTPRSSSRTYILQITSSILPPIPVEVLRIIATHLDVPSAHSLARVCKGLRDAGEMKIWRTIELTSKWKR